MQTHSRKGALVSWLAAGALLLLAALALPNTQASTRAQDAKKAAEQKTLLLTPDELAMWTDYLHGDCQSAYDRVTALLNTPDKLDFREIRIALALQRNLANELGNGVQHARALENVAKKSSVNGHLDPVHFELSQASRRVGQNKQADEHADELGYISAWWICGPFLNERGQGFEEEQGPETELSLTKAYAGKDGQNCAFRRLPASPVDGEIDVGAAIRPNTEATAFLLAAIWCDKEQPRDVQWGTTGDAVAFLAGATLDGQGFEYQTRPVGSALLNHSGERPFGFDQSFLGSTSWFQLVKGWNVCLVKLGHSEGPWKFRMRLCDRSGLKIATTDEELSEALGARKERVVDNKLGPMETVGPLDVKDALRELLAPRRETASDAPRRAFTKILSDHSNRITNEHLDSIAYVGESALLRFLLAEASKSQSRVASGKEENKRRELLEQVLKLDPKAARAALELAKYYSGTFRNPTEADRYAKLAVSLAPKWVEARVFAARVATMKGLEGEVERELSALLKEYPNHPSVLRFAGYYRGLRGDYVGSDELLKRCLEKGDFTDEYCRERLFTRAIERNDAEAALKYATETRQLNPFDLATSEGLIQLYLAIGSPERAMAECERALNICPREDKFLARKGEIYMRMAAREPAKAAEFKAKAIAAYRESLKCNPNNEDLARYLEFLADEKPIWETKLQENIEPRIEAALKQPVDGNDPYRVVYRDEITVVNDDGTKSIYFQYAYRICNDDGREVLQELGAPAYADQVGRCVGARVYRRDCSTEEGRRVESQAMLPPLDVGDIVAVRYRVSDTAQSFFGDFFGAIETLGDNVPVDEVRLVYVLPKSRKFFEYGVNGAPKAERREEGDKAIWTYFAKNLARVPRESNQLPLTQIVPTVQISTYETWKDFGRWYYNLIKKQLEPTPEMKAKVSSLIEGKSTERDKARAIYNWVVTNVRYNADWHFGVHGYKPFSAGAIFERCIGDCKDKAIVICTMLGIAGVKAYPVLIRLADSSEPRGREDITLPMPHHFNHAIAYIEYADGKGQFVDGTATFNGFDELPGGDAGAHVVIVRPEGGEQTLIPTPAPAQNAAIEEASLEFLGNGKVKLSVKLTATGDRASFLRAIYLQSGSRTTQIENQWARHKPGAKVLKVEANDLANIDLAPEVRYEVEIPDAYTTDAQGNIEFSTALNPLLFAKGMAAATTRRTDIAMNEPYQWHSTVRIKLPEGRIVENTASLFEDALGISLSVSVEVIDREVVITRTYASKGGVITAGDYPKLRAMMLAHDRAEAAKLKLVKE